MPTEATIEHRLLRDTARRYLDRVSGPTTSRAAFHDPVSVHGTLWRDMADMGWLGLAAGPEFGTDSDGFALLAALLEEMGRVCLPGPFFHSAALGTMVLSEFGSREQKERLLPGVVDGSRILTTAVGEGRSEFDPTGITATARRSGDAYVLGGRKAMVPYAELAGVILCVVRLADDQADEQADDRGGFGVLAVPSDAGFASTVVHEMSGPVSSDLVFTDVRLPASALLGGQPLAWKAVEAVLLKAAVAKCAEMVGGARQAMETAVAHAKERRQFGRPIGSFQAVQHHCANMLVLVETARRMVDETVAAVCAGDPHTARAAATKVWCNHVYREVVRLAHQVMGGLGYVDEHVMPWHFRHLRSCESTLGDSDTLLEIVAEGLYAGLREENEVITCR